MNSSRVIESTNLMNYFQATIDSISTQKAIASVKSTTTNISKIFFLVCTSVAKCHISPEVGFLLQDHSALKTKYHGVKTLTVIVNDL